MSARAVQRLGLRQVLRTKKFFIAVIVTLLPLLAGLLLLFGELIEARDQAVTGGRHATETLVFFVLGGTVPFTALLLAGGLLADDAEDRTLTYLLVRPVKRRTLYLAKASSVLLLTGALAATQAFLLVAMRFLSYLLVRGDPIEYNAADGSILAPFVDTCHACLESIDPGLLLARIVVPAMLTAFLLGAAFAAFFGFVSVVTTRFHFFASLLLFLSWELPFGNQGPAPGVLTFTYHAQSIVARVDPTTAASFRDAITPWIAAPALVVGALLWLAAGAAIAERRDFNVTSATS